MTYAVFMPTFLYLVSPIIFMRNRNDINKILQNIGYVINNVMAEKQIKGAV